MKFIQILTTGFSQALISFQFYCWNMDTFLKRYCFQTISEKKTCRDLLAAAKVIGCENIYQSQKSSAYKGASYEISSSFEIRSGTKSNHLIRIILSEHYNRFICKKIIHGSYFVFIFFYCKQVI